MKLTINGSEIVLAAGVNDSEVTVAAMLAFLGLTGPVAVELNREIVPRAQHAIQTVRAGDRVEVLHFVGGG
jgi:sulfur carrier protein